MMNDRFSSQLRQHLLDTADERPADGQLASVIDGVEATKQRHPLIARLTWTPGRIGPFPTAAIRFGLIAAALALATVAGAILAGGGGRSPSTVFEGSWITIDPADGSGMTLVVGAGMTPEVYFEDGYATGAACVNDTVKRFTARGTGAIEGNRLFLEFPDGGGCGLMTVEIAGFYDDYSAGSDMLVDQDGLAWSRPLAEPVPATQAPSTQGPPAEPTMTEPTVPEPTVPEPTVPEPTVPEPTATASASSDATIANRDAEGNPAQIVEAEALVASLRIEP